MISHFYFLCILIFFLKLCAVVGHVCSHFSGVQLFVTLWTVAHQAPLSTGFSKHCKADSLMLNHWGCPIIGYYILSSRNLNFIGKYNMDQ